MCEGIKHGRSSIISVDRAWCMYLRHNTTLS